MSRIDKLRKLLNELCPYTPYEDAQIILEAAAAKDKKALPHSISLWLALIARIRHQHTEYEKLLEEGYERDAARYFTREAINAVLQKWGCRKRISEDDEGN
jgi:hypothetical protein